MDEQDVETTNVTNKDFRTYAPPKDKRFECGAEAFNQLSPIPKEALDLGDGRLLNIVEWNAFSGPPEKFGQLKVEIKCLICLKDKK